MRGRRHACSAPILVRQHLAYAAGGKLSQTDLDEGADDAAAHFVKKTVAFNNQREETSATPDLATGYGTNG